MKFKRFWYIFRISLMKNGFQRAKYLKKKNIFASMGENCFWQPRYIPPETKLIKLHDNVVIAAKVWFIPHDAIHYMIKNIESNHINMYQDCIEVGSNTFIGSNTTILAGTYIEGDSIIGAGSLVKGIIRKGGVYCGMPLRKVKDFYTFVDNRISRSKYTFEDLWEQFDEKWR